MQIEVSTGYLWMDGPAAPSYAVSWAKPGLFSICRADTKNYKITRHDENGATSRDFGLLIVINNPMRMRLSDVSAGI